MSLAQQNRYFRDAGPQLIDMVEQKAGEVDDLYTRAQHAWTLADAAKTAFDCAKSILRVKLEICGDQQLKLQASSVTDTNALVDNAREAEGAADSLLEMRDRSQAKAKRLRATQQFQVCRRCLREGGPLNCLACTQRFESCLNIRP